MQSFTQSCGQSISTVLTQALGSRWEASTVDVPVEYTQQADVHLCFAASKTLNGVLEFTLTRADAVRLAQLFMAQEPEENSEWNKELEESLDELFRQVCGNLATALTGHYGETVIQMCEKQDISSTSTSINVAAKADGQSEVKIVIRVSPELASALQPVQQPPHEITEVHSSRSMDAKNLDLLMGVVLSATLRFGKKRMLLREVLDLDAGCVIELDRRVGEPVDLLLDGKVIARGEVVLVDGSYGLRVTDVSSQRSRAELVP